MLTTSLRLLCVTCAVSGVSLHAGTVPYFENFDDDTAGSSTPAEPAPESGTFSTVGSGWSVVSGGISDQSFNFTNGSGNQSFGASIDFVGSLGGAAATAENFTLSSEFRFNTGTVGNALAGLGALGTSSTFGTGYWADVASDTGIIRFVRNNSEVPGTVVDAGTVTFGEAYTLTIDGLYIDTNADTVNDALQLTATVSGAGLSGSTTFTDSNPVETGFRFGYRHRNSTSGTDVNLDMDNFSVAIPEPSSMALLASSAGFLSLARRRRRE